MGLLELIFPKTCVGCRSFGAYLCEKCVTRIEYLENQVCCYCYKHAISGKTHPYCQKQFGIDGLVSLTVYKNPIQDLIKSLKYRFTEDLLEEFSQKFKFNNNLVSESDRVLVPIPLHKSRANMRGFNQAELLGEIVAKKFKLKYRPNLLKRLEKTKSQVGLSQKERSSNVKAAFTVNQVLENKKYYIFDDVWTSGATLKEAARELKKAGATSVWGLTLAHPR